MYDISYCQTAGTIEVLKKNGAGGIIVRNGYLSKTDTMWYTHIKEAVMQKIPMLGTYTYIMARTIGEAREEASNTLYRISNCPAEKNINMPVYLDFEDARAGQGKDRDVNTDILLAEAQIIADAGFNVGIYTNYNYIQNYIDLSRIMRCYPKCSLWLADYRSTPYNPVYPIDIWQRGIKKYNLDEYDYNECYVDFAKRYVKFK